MRPARGPRFGSRLGLGIALLAGMAISLLECGAAGSPASSALTIVEKASAPEFKAEFNRAGAAARLVLLLSPT
ncbi:MAG: hypothetical protein M3167_08650 [Acidobacteriota bacterium]|nr:hypothetical protein [Acidobacteriota bacterium]